MEPNLITTYYYDQCRKFDQNRTLGSEISGYQISNLPALGPITTYYGGPIVGLFINMLLDQIPTYYRTKSQPTIGPNLDQVWDQMCCDLDDS